MISIQSIGFARRHSLLDAKLNTLITEHNTWSLLALAVPAICGIWPFRRRPHTGEQLGSPDPTEPTSRNVAVIDYVDWGIRLVMLGKIDRAADRFKQAVEKNDKDAVAHYNHALALDTMGNYSEAIGSYERAAQLSPDSADIWCNYGAALLASGRSEGAIEQLRKALQLAPEDPVANYNLGCAYVRAGRDSEAIPLFRRSLECDPNDAQVIFNLAVALVRSGASDLAQPEFQKFLALVGSDFEHQRQHAENILAESENGVTLENDAI